MYNLTATKKFAIAHFFRKILSKSYEGFIYILVHKCNKILTF